MSAAPQPKRRGTPAPGLRVVGAARSLDALAEAATDEYRLAVGAAANAVEHAIACGDILLAAQVQVPPGRWGAWCRANVPDINDTTVTKFCRLAAHKEAIATGQFTTIAQALGYLYELGTPPRPSGPLRTYRSFDHDEARRLHAQGLDYKGISEVLGVSDQTISLHLNPERLQEKKAYQKRYSRRLRDARAAQAREERDRSVRASGGLPAEAYALLRRTALVIDKAIGQAEDATERTKLVAALGFVHKAEDEIVRALRLERAAPSRPPQVRRRA